MTPNTNEREGAITAVSAGFLVVELAPLTGCGRCQEKDGCGRSAAAPPRRYVLPDTINARVGEKVIVSVAGGAVLNAALWVYLLPLILLFVGAFVGENLGGDSSAIGGALVGLAVGFIVLRRVSRRAPACTKRESPLAVRRPAAAV